MTENLEPKIRTILILLIGAVVMLLLSYACALDWINKINAGIDWSTNLWYHPLSGVLGLILLTLSIVFILEKVSSGKMERLHNALGDKKQLKLVFLGIAIVSMVILIVSSYLLLEGGTTGVGALIILHTLMGIIFGVSFMILLLKGFISRYMNAPMKWQNYILIIVIILVVIFVTIVAVARAMGLLTL